MLSTAKLFIVDDQHPEDVAMLQALYSRSSESVETHLEKVKATGSGKFMASYYIGYGHESIGDCGTTTLFIEGVSILAAKAIQDWALYSGQETSTRYIDMSAQAIEDPLGTADSKAILDRWMKFYRGHQETIAAHLKTRYPKQTEEKEASYEKAIKARGFDIMRSFLPAGITTQLAWHTNLRQALKKCTLLKHHPDPSIKELGTALFDKLAARYPNSFIYKTYEAQDRYQTDMSAAYSYFHPETCQASVKCETTLTEDILAPYQDAIDTRPIKTELPSFLLDLGLIKYTFLLDYGSFRDLQRHRHGVCRMPLVTTRFGFQTWYLEQLPEAMYAEAIQLIQEQTTAIEALEGTPIQKQYYTAMGFLVPCSVTWGLPAALYTIELRSGKTVHPSLRRIVHQMARTLQEKLPSLKMHVDFDLDDWDVRRGEQDIVRK